MKHTISMAVGAVMAAGGWAWAEDAALVIGNAKYDHAPKALAAEADARAAAEALEKAGYEVTLGVNLSRVKMRAAMDEFARDAEDAEKVVIFFSGHAMRMNGQTFLAPVDFRPVGPVSVAFDGAPFAALQALAAEKGEGSIIFLDGAQLDGFDATDYAEPGIAPISAEKGARVVSAAAPGWAIRRSSEGRSKFGKAVTDHFLAAGVAYPEALEKAGDAVWSTGADGPLILVDAAAEAESSGDGVELAFWRSVEAGGTEADYRAYLSRYPNGLFAAIAQNRVKAASTDPEDRRSQPNRQKTAAEIAAEGEASLNLGREERRRIQGDLTALGYDTRGVDGIFGRGTRGAIRGWQEAEGETATGFLTADQIAKLRDDAKAEIARQEARKAEQARLSAEEAAAEEAAFWERTQQVNTVGAYQRYLRRYPEGKNAGEATRILNRVQREQEEAIWEEAKRVDTAAAYDRYLDLYPNGRWQEIAQRRLEARRADQAPQDDEAAFRAAADEGTARAYADFFRAYPDSRFAEEARRRNTALKEEAYQRREARLNLSGDDWRGIGQRLQALGFRVGAISASPTNDLRRAIFNYRRSRGLPEHNYVDEDFINLLVRETRQVGAGQLLNDLFNRLKQ